MSARDWAEKDYYKVLGVPKDADAAAIKTAYRKLARDNHPDRHTGDKSAEARFKRISEANSVVGDPVKRKEYDQSRSLFGSGSPFRGFGSRGSARPGPGPSGGGTGGGTGGFGFDLGDLFGGGRPGQTGGTGTPPNLGDVFGGLFNSQRTRTDTSRARRGADTEAEVRIGFTAAVDGATLPLRTTGQSPCPACRGTGAKAGTMPHICSRCEGTGTVLRDENGTPMPETCPDCRGRGLVVDDPCPQCHGSGRAESTKTMQVRIPAGVEDGQVLRLRGKGAAGENGGPAGDLLVRVRVDPHPTFGRKEGNLTVTVPVSFADAALGGSVRVPTLNGPSVLLKIPANTPNGRAFRVRGKGAARRDGTRGDLLVTAEVTVPDSLDADAREALEKFRAATRAAGSDPAGGGS